MRKFTLVLWLILAVSSPAFGAEADIASTAKRYIGMGEVGGNNLGSFVRKVNGYEGEPWCAGFVSYVLKNSVGYKKTTLRALDFWNDMDSFFRVSKPMSGDLMCFRRGGGGGHVGIVYRVTSNKVLTIEGNVGKFPAKVKIVEYEKDNMPKNFLGFVRVKNNANRGKS